MILDNIRKSIPKIIAEEIISVQPMGDYYLKDFSRSGTTDKGFEDHERVHNFILGWGRYYKGEFLTEEDYQKHFGGKNE